MKKVNISIYACVEELSSAKQTEDRNAKWWKKKLDTPTSKRGKERGNTMPTAAKLENFRDTTSKWNLAKVNSYVCMYVLSKSIE